MEQEKLDRLNHLTKKKKAQGLTDAELQEQANLRAEYIAAFRESLRNHLESITVLEADGTKRKLKRTPRTLH